MHRSKLVLLVGTIAIFAACSKPANNTSVEDRTKNVASNSTPSERTSSSPAVSDKSANGGELYSTSCAKCHRDDGTGGKITVEGKTIKPDNLAGPKLTAKSDEKLFEYISEGAPDDGMPAFKEKLSVEEIKQIVAFMRSDIQKAPPPNANGN